MDKAAKEVTAEHARQHTSCKCHRIQQESMCTPHLCTVCACFLVCTKFTSAPCSHGWSWQSGVLSATSLPTSPPHMPTENCCCWLTLLGPAPATDIRWATGCDSSGDGRERQRDGVWCESNVISWFNSVLQGISVLCVCTYTCRARAYQLQYNAVRGATA